MHDRCITVLYEMSIFKYICVFRSVLFFNILELRFEQNFKIMKRL